MEVPVVDKSSKLQIHNNCDSVGKCQLCLERALLSRTSFKQSFRGRMPHRVFEQTILYRKYQNGKILGSQYKCISTKQIHFYMQAGIHKIFTCRSRLQACGSPLHKTRRVVKLPITLAENQFHRDWIFLEA